MTTVQISETLRQLIEQFANMARNAAEVVDQIKEQAQKEGISDEHLRELIEVALKKRGLSDGHIRKMIPAELKREYHRSEGNSRKMRDSEPEPEEEEAPHKISLKEERKVVDAEPDVVKEAKDELKDEKKTTFLKDEYELDRLKAQNKALMEKLSEKHGSDPVTKEVKQENMRLKNTLREYTEKEQKWQSSNTAKLEERVEALSKEVQMLSRVAQPFKTATRVEIRGQEIPIILEVDPRSKRILHAEIDEQKAKRLFA